MKWLYIYIYIYIYISIIHLRCIGGGVFSDALSSLPISGYFCIISAPTVIPAWLWKSQAASVIATCYARASTKAKKKMLFWWSRRQKLSPQAQMTLCLRYPCFYLSSYLAKKNRQLSMYVPNPSVMNRIWHKVILKQSTDGLNSVFFLSLRLVA